MALNLILGIIMAAIFVPKKKSKVSKKVKKAYEFTFTFSLLSLAKILLLRIPLLLLILIFLWSASTTIISGNMVHICMSSRKLNLYCISAGAQPHFQIPGPFINATSFNPKPEEESIEKRVLLPVYNILQENPGREAYHHDVEKKNALMDVEEQIRIHRSWISPHHQKNTKQCKGRGIYVYDLPSKFNKEIMSQCNSMIPWVDLCKFFSNGGLGEPIQKLGKGWYNTHQYALEPIFHLRALNHPCRVHSPNEAQLFYVPFYGGLDVLRWHFKNVSDDIKDSLSRELVKWLQTQEPWFKNSGKDHVFVLGKISWDFRRYNGSSWGSRFLEFDEMQNPVKLLIERNPWHINDVSIPHPTFFHPESDDDIITWQTKIITSNRQNLISFAGASRPDSTKNIRSILIDQCSISGDCRFMNCSTGSCNDQPESFIELFMESEFCLQPPGDSSTRKSVFDSLISGCIPVLFDPFTAYYQYPWHLPEDHENYSVFIEEDDVRSMRVNVAEKLLEIPKERRDSMRRYIVYELLPRLVYGGLNSKVKNFEDAFSVTVDNLIERMNKL